MLIILSSLLSRVALAKCVEFSADEWAMTAPTASNSFGRDQSSAALLPDDPEMADLLEFFISELRVLIEKMQDAWKAGDFEDLQRLAHQLKSAGGGYGFPEITDCASTVEMQLLAEEANLSAINEKVEALICICRRVTGNK